MAADPPQTPPASAPDGSTASAEPVPSRAGFTDPQQLLKHLWQQNLPVFRQRVTFLQQAAAEHTIGRMDAATRAEAGNTAHKLAGSLGMFGYSQGTDIARELEHLLDGPETPDAGRFTLLAEQLREAVPL